MRTRQSTLPAFCILPLAILGACAASGSSVEGAGSAAPRHVVVTHRIAKTGKMDALVAASTRLVTGMQSADGVVDCRLFASADASEPVALISTWVDQAKAEEFRASAAGRALIGPELESGLLSAVDQSWQVDAELVLEWPEPADATTPAGAHVHSLHAVAKRGERDGLVAAFAETARSAMEAKGLLAYFVYASSDRDGPVTSISIWASRAQHEQFMQSETGKAMVSPGVSPKMDSMIDRAWTVESRVASSWRAANN